MFYPTRWKKITVDQSKVLKNLLFRYFWATRYRMITCTWLTHVFCFYDLHQLWESVCENKTNSVVSSELLISVVFQIVCVDSFLVNVSLVNVNYSYYYLESSILYARQRLLLKSYYISTNSIQILRKFSKDEIKYFQYTTHILYNSYYINERFRYNMRVKYVEYASLH